MSKFPTHVPVTEVAEYTDNIIIGNLGQPVGFDLDQLSLNVRAIERVRALAWLGTVSIVGRQGHTTEHRFMSQANTAGEATVGGFAQRDKIRLGGAEVEPPTLVSTLGRRDVTLVMNNTEAEKRIRDEADRYPLQQFDPIARADMLNRAMKEGLVSASYQANLSKLGLATTACFTAAMLLGPNNSLLARDAPPIAKLIPASVLLNNVLHMWAFSAAKYFSRDKYKINERDMWYLMRSVRQSMFFGSAPDRFAAASLYVHSHRFSQALSKQVA